MQRRVFQFAILLLWLALPLVVFDYQHAWEQLPASMATHFDAAHHANGWMTREESRRFSVGMIAIALAVSTVVLLAASWRKVEAVSWALYGFFALLIGFLVSVHRTILTYNVSGAPVHPERTMWLLPVGVLVVIAVYLLSRRQAALPPSEELAVERHGAGAWVGVILVAILGPAVTVALAKSVPALFALCVVGVIGGGALAMAWSGFQYRFLRQGVEIRTLGFRLRSIPKQTIVSYSIEPWSLIRGYGIRGIGGTRAYVWCNKVVHIRTSNGDVYLGHDDPERVVRDLDMVTGFVRGG
jgi:hypothetical protein